VVDRYLVLLDAGSVHTSVYTYRYYFPEPGKPLEVIETNFCELGQTGISDFVKNPSGAARFISTDPCVLSSIAAIPEESKNVSTLLLGSTAGMRVLKLSKPLIARQILDNLSNELGVVSNGLKHDVKVLTGEEEGLDGWVTANYLLGSLEKGEQVGALDWGGASSQITRTVDSTENNVNLTINGKIYNLMAMSNLCYGQSEAFKRNMASLFYDNFANVENFENLTDEVILTDPCLPKDYKSSPIALENIFNSPCTSLQDKSFMEKIMGKRMNVIFKARQNHSSCSNNILELFDPSTCQAKFEAIDGEETCMDPNVIPEPGNLKFLAFSTYWYLASGLNLTSSFTLNEFNDQMTELCSSSIHSSKLEKLKDLAPRACFQATFMKHMLTKAYHFNEDTWTQISFVKRISDAEVGWSLGHAIAHASKDKFRKEASFISKPLFVALVCCSLVLMVVAVIAILQGRLVSIPYNRMHETV